MSVLDHLFTAPARERGGAINQSRLGYQAAWAILEMLERLVREEPYTLFVFELHEDVLIISDADGSEVVECFQVKTTGSAHRWTVARLLSTATEEDATDPGKQTKRAKAKTAQPKVSPDQLVLSATLSPSARSILGKLVDTGARLGCPPVRSVHMVTNATVGITRRSGAPEGASLCIADVDPSELAELRKRLESELGHCPDSLSHIFLTVSDVAVAKSYAHVIGMMATSVLPKLSIKPEYARAVYESLDSEVRRCSSHEVTAASAGDLRATRTISAAEIRRVLDEAKVRGQQANWSEVSQILTTWQAKAIQVTRMQAAYTRVATDRLDPSNATSSQAFRDITSLISDVVQQGTLSTFQELLDLAIKRLRRKQWFSAYKETELATLLAIGLHEHKELPAVDSQSSKETS